MEMPLVTMFVYQLPFAQLPTDSENRQLVDRVWLSWSTLMLFAAVILLLGAATVVARYVSRQNYPSFSRAHLERFVLRLRVWWLMAAMLMFALLLHRIGTVILFFGLSFWAFREFITMTQTRRGDHRALFWSLILLTPLQYVLIGIGHTNWRLAGGGYFDAYSLYSVLIPVYATLFIPARIAVAGDCKKFLERSAQITLGLMICVYSLSHAPALLDLELRTADGQPWAGSNAELLFFFVLISQLSDVAQWSWTQLIGRRQIAGDVSSSRTWEGCLAATLTAAIIGGALAWVTPFESWVSAALSAVVAFVGCMGGLVMSAIKRDRGLSDYGSLVIGHAGVLDRIDSLCFAAPIFYHLTRFFYTQ